MPPRVPTRPTLDHFLDLARDHTVVPVWIELACDLETPVSVFSKLSSEEETAFLLESVENGQAWGRFSFVGRRPTAVLVVRGMQVAVSGTVAEAVPRDQGAMAAVQTLLGAYRSPRLDDLPPLHGGIVGFLGYDVVREVEHLPDVPPDDRQLPDAVLSVIGQVAAFDHWRQRLYLVDNVVVEPGEGTGELSRAYEEAADRLAVMVEELGRPLEYRPSPPAPVDPSGVDGLGVVANLTPEQFQANVEVARTHIRAGDIFQVVLSQRFDFDLGCDPFEVYRVLRQVNPSPYMYFLRHPEATVVGSSPEPMVQLRDGRVVSRPIAGTRWRSPDPAEDERLAGELATDPKEVAEHVMLVDLARNDLGRVVDFGTEKVEELMVLERYSHVMHLTSQVAGSLRGGLGPIDVLRATLPAGTVSGAPKVRAMEIIDALEPTKRGPYAGVVGYFDFSGNLDTAITIRTLVADGTGRAWVQAGAGIVADSDPAAEDAESRNKAAALLAAAAAARARSEPAWSASPSGSEQ